MPAKTIKVRRAMAIAEHHPEKLYARNRGLLKMDKEDLHEFASTPEKGLPYSAKSRDREKKKTSRIRARHKLNVMRKSA